MLSAKMKTLRTPAATPPGGAWRSAITSRARRFPGIQGKGYDVLAMAVAVAPGGAVRRKPSQRVHGILQPRASRRQVDLAKRVRGDLRAHRGCIKEIEQRIDLRFFHLPVVVE